MSIVIRRDQLRWLASISVNSLWLSSSGPIDGSFAHFHRKGEGCTLVWSIRVHSDGALTQTDKLVDDHEAHADALTVHVSCAFQLAE